MTLFAFIGLWWATAGVGAAAISIPVIIHLINRRRFKIVEWAAMKFLLAAQKQTRKRMRIEQLLLLLCRMAILGLLLLAMAAITDWGEAIWKALHLNKLGPQISKRSHRIHHIFVLDASLSMNQKVDGELTAFELAKQLAVKKINNNPSGDGYSVLVLKDSPTWLVAQAAVDHRKVIKELEAVQPSHGNASLASAFSMISAKLSENEGRFKKNQAVYFFTDLQRGTWQAAAPSTSDLRGDEGGGKERRTYLDLQNKASTFLVDCGPAKDAGNIAVTGLEFDPYFAAYLTPNTDLILNATVDNFSTETKKDLRIEVLIGRAREDANDSAFQLRVVDQISATIPANEKRELEFTKVKFPSAGTYVVQVRIADDALNPDNFRSIVISVRETIPILLVNGKASADRFERATEYLRLALNPFPAGEEVKGWPLRPEVVTPGRFSDMTEKELEKYDCIYWCDVADFRSNDVRKIETHLRRGGGFVVSMGKEAAERLNHYNDLLHNEEKGTMLLPAMLMKKVVAAPDHVFYMNNTDPLAFKLPPLAAFENDKDQRTLRNARFRQFVLAKTPETRARTVLSFMTEITNADKVKRDPDAPTSEPAILEWNPPMRRAKEEGERQGARYRGKVILITTALNMDWGAWPASPSYGAMMHELTRLALSGRLREQNQTVGDALEAYLPGGTEQEVTVFTPNKLTDKKKVKTQAADDLNLFRYPSTHDTNTDFAGIYRAESTKGFDLPFAVNVPISSIDNKGIESDLFRLNEIKLGDLYPDWQFKIVKSATDVLVTGGTGEEPSIEVEQPVGPELASYLLLIVVALLFAEILMAWLFGHYSTTEGALTNAPAGPAATTTAAAIAIMSTILFVIGIFVVLNYYFTGDFLSFVPDLLRTYIERQIGLESVAAGEGSNWRYEQMPWLFGMPNENWFAGALTIGAIIAIFLTYKAEAPTVSIVFKLLLGALRLYLILFVVWFILPRPQIQYERTSNPDLVILIDDSRSMGEPDVYQKAKDAEREKQLGELIKKNLVKELPERIASLEAQIDAKLATGQKDPEVKAEIDGLRQRLSYWLKQKDQINTGKWRPSRLQLVQAILTQPEPHWLKTILGAKKTKVHIFHLNVQGKALKLRDDLGDAGDIIDVTETKKIERALSGIAKLEPVGDQSRLGTAIKEVIDHYRGSGLSQVIMFTDGVTTRDENIVEAGVYASLKGIPLLFVGIGDEQQLRDLRLTDMQLENPVYLGDNLPIEAKITGKGYKDLSVTVVLRVEDKDGKESELKRQAIKIDPSGQPTRIRFEDQPKELGKRKYIIQVEPPKTDPNEKPITPANLRLEKMTEVIDIKEIKVLYVEGQPRYEFRYVKFLMEREAPDEKLKKKSIDLTVLLLDADEDWAARGRKDGKGTDATAISVFPPTLEALKKYDVLIIGDCDPKHQKLKDRLMDIKRFALGINEKDQKDTKPGGGVLFIAGSSFNPHKYKNNPLADILPVEPTADFQREVARTERWHPSLTNFGATHPIFRFRQDERENRAVFNKLQPLYWSSTSYKANRHAEVLAVHPTEKSAFKNENLAEDAEKHPLVVQQTLSNNGRSMFFGFDETWRWRFREDEKKFNQFWVQTMRYLSRMRPTQTNLALNKQTPYNPGEEIKITVTFPDFGPAGNEKGPKINDKTDVKVTVSYLPPDAQESKDGKRDPEVYQLQLAKTGPNKYDGKWSRTREGKYIFRLTDPDVSGVQPDGRKPSAEAMVELPPGELERLRMNYQEMTEAASKTLGEFVTLSEADGILERLRPGDPVHSPTAQPPTTLWNQWWVYILVLVLITSEWVLRKLKHLL